ncbi:hypothetical protein [Myxacorys almedinensis]|uniref:Uncharacterized protein n=1 Tax=Myxacorys almedinensis A TaxID=2690445 RepID=A0A8J8CHQ1_9CYAN|nr:hypothetical protein [Myxacorys almedinensis]NDJ15696.1 hypothetical protein [Myxacorys almedinensis A]
MTHDPDEDQDLVSFLKHHRPMPPPASASLEHQIMRMVQGRDRVVRPMRWWASGALLRLALPIAAGLVGAVAIYQTTRPASFSTTEVASLEAFIETSWLNSVSGVSTTATDTSAQEFLALVEPLASE